MIDSSLSQSRKKSLARSADRYIPSRTSTDPNFIRSVFNRKVKSALLQKSHTLELPSSQTPKKTEDLSDSFLCDSETENDPKIARRDEDADSTAPRASDASSASLSANDSLDGSCNASRGCLKLGLNDGSFNASRGAARLLAQSSSPCSARSKSAAKRAKNALNSEVFFGVEQIRETWRQRILSFNEAVGVKAAQSQRPPLNSTPRRSLKAKRKLEQRAMSIPRKAEKVLDAPLISQKTSYNLLDWTSLVSASGASTDVLAVALSDDVYFWFGRGNHIASLSNLTPPEPDGSDREAAKPKVAGVHWFGGGFLAIGREDAKIEIFSFHNCLDSEGHPRLSGAHGAVRMNSLSLPRASGAANAFAWGRRRKLLVCAATETPQAHSQPSGSVLVFRFAGKSAKAVARLNCGGGEVSRLAWSPLGDTLAVGCSDGCLRLFSEAAIAAARNKADSFVESARSAEVRGRTKALAWCPWRSDLLAAGSSAGEITIASAETSGRAEVKARVSVGKGAVTGLLFLPQNAELLSSHAGGEHGLLLWAFPELVVRVRLSGHTRGVLGLAGNLARTLVASAGRDESVRVWRVNEEEKGARVSGADCLEERAAFR